MGRKSRRRRTGTPAPGSVLQTWDSLVRLNGLDPTHPVVVRARAAMVAGTPSPDGPLFFVSTDPSGKQIFGPTDVGRRAIPAPPPPSDDDIAAAFIESVEMPAADQIADIKAFLREAPLAELESCLAGLREWPLYPGESWEDRAGVAADIRRAIAIRTGTTGRPRRPGG